MISTFLGSVVLASSLGPPPQQVVIVSDGDSTIDAAAQQRLREAARTGGERNESYAFTVRNQPCPTPNCVSRILETPDVDAAVVLRVDVEGRDYSFRLDLVAPGLDAAGPQLSIKDSCEVCGLEEVGTLVEDSMGTLLDRYTRAVAPATLTLSTTPAGAEVFDGGTPLGRTPLEVELPPGQHTLELRRPGYELQKRTLTVAAGEALAVDAQLVALPPPPPKWRSLAITGAVGIATGFATVAAGAVLVVIDERTVRCSDTETNEFGVCPRRYATLEGGAAAIAIGGALVVTGVVLEAIALRRRGRGSSVARWRNGALRF